MAIDPLRPLPKHTKTLLVIVAEAAIEARIVRAAREAGAQSWTVAEVHGAGREGVREGAWEADRTVEIKVVCDADVADAIARRVLDTWGAHYSVALHFATVQVLRPDRY